MKVFPIKSPIAGEQVVGVHPEIQTFVEQDWRKRLNYYSGRALTHTALRSEQEGRSGRIATLGQMLSAGVVEGLEADKVSNQTDETPQSLIQISPGSGIAASGEVVTLSRALQVDLRDIRVYAPVTELLSDGLAEAAVNATALSGIMARKLGPSLQQVIDSGRSLPPAAILILQPVQVEMRMQQEDDPCELDPANYAYENWQRVDGARLVLYSWPEEVLTLPVPDPSWRNRLANEIFTLEQHLSADESLPWLDVGVPIALIGFDEHWDALFVDRYSVARAGGKRRRTASILPDVGNRFLWQARFEQFNEHLADVLGGLVDGDLAIQSAAAFRYLPPIGVLPKSFIDFTRQEQHFFPLNYHVEAVVIPFEQLDVVVQDSAALAAYDFNRADRIQTLVPVPQIYYEPDLLKLEVIDPEFDATIQRFTEARNNWLGRRLEIRRKASAINQALIGEPLEFALPDPDAVDNAELAAPFETALVEFGTVWRYLKGTAAPADSWTIQDFSDGEWSSGATGIGYGMAGNVTELEDMQGNYLSVFCRKTFTLTEIDQAKNYKLVIVTNGGFYAYLNGQEIKNHNLSGRQFNVPADAEIEAVAQEFDLGALTQILHTGENLLAIQAHSHDRMSAGFTFAPRLIEKRYVADIEAEDYSTTIILDDNNLPVLQDFEPVYNAHPFTKLRTFIAGKTFLSTEEKSQLDSLGIEKYIEFLQTKVDQANDKVDYGFLRLQTDIYRVRQFILGNVEATRLATSPVLASIAQSDNAVATKAEISKVAEILKTPGAVALTTATSGGSGGTQQPTVASSPAIKSTDLFVSGELGINLPRTTAPTATVEPAIVQKIDLSASGTKAVLDREATSSGILLGTKTTTPVQIEEQSYIVGNYETFNNVTVGERLKQPVSTETKDAGLATKAETLQGFVNLGISVGDLAVPGFKDGANDVTKKFADISADTIADILSGAHDPHGDDESSMVNAGVKAMENTTAFLRLIEGRIKSYKVIITRCQATIEELREILGRMDVRLKIIADELAEARHDVSVSRALKDEELGRLAGINARRQAILEEQVPFLLFRRPRLSEVLINTPVHTLHPDLSNVPLPLCNVDDAETPEEISAMMDVIKEAPLKWFAFSDALLKRLNRLDDLQVLIKSAKSRAKTKTGKHRLLNVQYDGLNRLASGINKTLQVSYQSVTLQRQQTALIDVTQFSRLGWNETKTRANEVISLGDIIDGNHGRMGVGKMAAQELEQIERVALCLYLRFTAVLPSIRLDWAERLSQFDASVNLRNLYSLPRWGEIDYLERNALQRLVDWLYQRIVPAHSAAADLISDLIRITILLASHAPVNKIISGLLPQATTVRVGSRVNIIADLSRVRIGMNIAVVSGLATVARGTVADIAGGQVTAQIVSTATSSVALEKNAKVQIGEPSNFAGVAYQQTPFLFMK